MAWRERPSHRGMADRSAARRSAAIARRFGAAAAGYESQAELQRMSAERLAAFLAESGGLPDGPVAEVGCGTGLLTRLLADGSRTWLATDIAPEMVERCRANLAGVPGLDFAVMDGQRPAFPEPPATIVSNLAAQWFDDPATGLAALARQARTLAFAVPTAGSFAEWEAAFAALGRSSGLLALPEPGALLAALAGLKPARLQHVLEERRLHYPSGRAFADSLRRLGADQPRPGYRPGPIRQVLARFAAGMDVGVRILYCRLDMRD